VLLLDEPTANLDLGHQLDVIAAAKSRADRGAAVVAILHDLNLAALLAKRLVVVHRGRIHSDGPADQVITDPMLGRVFGVADAVARIPAEGTPFVLPHGARKLLPATP
jgi:iron complex transport system ATP-binding protein